MEEMRTAIHNAHRRIQERIEASGRKESAFQCSLMALLPCSAVASEGSRNERKKDEAVFAFEEMSKVGGSWIKDRERRRKTLCGIEDLDMYNMTSS